TADVEWFLDDTLDRRTDTVQGVRAERSHDNDSRQELGTMFSEVVNDAEAVDARHHQIERDDVVLMLHQHLNRFSTIANGVHRKAVAREDSADQDSDRGIIIDDERAAGIAHLHTCLDPPGPIHRKKLRADMITGGRKPEALLRTSPVLPRRNTLKQHGRQLEATVGTASNTQIAVAEIRQRCHHGPVPIRPRGVPAMKRFMLAVLFFALALGVRASSFSNIPQCRGLADEEVFDLLSRAHGSDPDKALPEG